MPAMLTPGSVAPQWPGKQLALSGLKSYVRTPSLRNCVAADNWKEVPQALCISTGGVMGLRLTEGDEKTPRSSNHFLWNCRPFFLSSRAYPDFLPRCTGNGRVCGFQ
jgi:hypothetical protein